MRLGRCSPAERLARPAVEGNRHGCKVVGAVHAEVGALREVLAQQPVGVLIRAALPWAVRIAEVDLKTGVDPQACVLAHLRPLIPSQRLSQLLGQGVIERVRALRTASAPCPASAGPFLARGPLP